MEIENLKNLLIKSNEASVHVVMTKAKNFKEKVENDEVLHEAIEWAGRLVLRTMKDLLRELVNINGELNRERDQNESRTIEIDQLRAMIRVSSGDGIEYRKRTNELNDFIQRMNQEIWLLKNSQNNTDENENFIMYEERINCIKSMINKLRIKLKNDHNALLTGGNIWLSKYIRKIRELEISVESLLLQLETTESIMKVDRKALEDSSEYNKGITQIKQYIKNVAYELENLTMMQIKYGFHTGNESYEKYYRRIKTLENLVISSQTIIDKLLSESKQFNGLEESKKIVSLSESKQNIESLAVFAKKLTNGIKQMEMVISTDDSLCLSKKNYQLEVLVKRLKSKIAAREEENNSLTLELTGAKIAYSEKLEELDKINKKYEKMATRMKKRGESLDCEERIESLTRELEVSNLEMKILRDELNRSTLQVTNIQKEKAGLIDEIEKNRSVVEAKNEEILKMTKDRKNKERALTNDAKSKLANSEKEIKCLKKEILDIKDDMETRENRATIEFRNLKSLLKTTKETLDSKNHKLTHIESSFNELVIDKTKIEQKLSCSTKQNEALVICLNFEKAAHSKTLKDLEKLGSNFQTLTNDFSNLDTERKNLRQCLDDSEREKNNLRTEMDEHNRKNASMEAELSSLKLKLRQLTQNLEDINEKNREMDARLEKINEENRNKATQIDALIKKNDKLNDELDIVRSDKLNITGTLTEAKYNFELTKNLLDKKITEMKNVEEKMKLIFNDLEKLRVSENLTKLENDKLLQTNSKLREMIDMANSDKAKLEKRLKDMEDDFKTLEHKISGLIAEKKALVIDTSMLNERVKELTEENTNLRLAAEKNHREHLELIDEHQKTRTELQEKLAGFENERVSLVNEMTRIADENSSLKRDYEEIACENETIRSQGKKSEINQLKSENEVLKFELSKLRIFITEADREVAKNEMEKMCSELVRIRAENSTLKKLRNRRNIGEKITDDSHKLEKQLNAWRTANEALRKNLEDARNKIAINDERAKEFETEKNMLKGSIEGLKERYRVSRREIDDARLRNEKLDKEISELRLHFETTKLEKLTLEHEVKNLHLEIVSLKEEYSKTRKNITEMEKELTALKNELAKSRTEINTLNVQFDTKNVDFHRLETENASLKHELEETQSSRMSMIAEMNELRSEQEKLVSLKMTLENKLIHAEKEIEKYVVATAKLNDLDCKLKTVFKSYVITKKLLKTANEEIIYLRRFTNPSLKNSNYNEKIEAT